MTAAILHQCILPANTNSGLNEPDSAAALAPLCMTCMTKPAYARRMHSSRNPESLYFNLIAVNSWRAGAVGPRRSVRRYT